MATIFDIVNANEIGDYYQEDAGNRIPFLGEVLFPAARNIGLDLSWIKSAGGVPVSLRPSAFDANATVRDRIGLERVVTEMPFFRESMRIGERERQNLMQALQTNNSAYFQPIINRIYDDAANLLDGARVVPERMIMQLLSTGRIAIFDEATRQELEYDYKVGSDQRLTLTGTDRWSDPNAKIVDTITTALDNRQTATGERPSRAITTLKVWNNMLKNAELKLAIQPLANPNAPINTTQLTQYLQAQLGLTVQVYDKPFAYQDAAGNNINSKFFPDDVFTLLPAGQLGNTYYGTTPEEADLLGNPNANAQVRILNGGVALTTKTEYGPPVNVQTIVSEIVLPSFEASNKIFIINV